MFIIMIMKTHKVNSDSVVNSTQSEAKSKNDYFDEKIIQIAKESINDGNKTNNLSIIIKKQYKQMIFCMKI